MTPTERAALAAWRPSEDPRQGYMDGYSVRVESRRRYGCTTYTWMEARRDDSDEWRLLGDPWPCMTPRRAEVHAAALAVLFA